MKTSYSLEAAGPNLDNLKIL